MGQRAAAYAQGMAATYGDPGEGFFDALTDDAAEAAQLHAARRGQLMEQRAMNSREY